MSQSLQAAKISYGVTISPGNKTPEVFITRPQTESTIFGNNLSVSFIVKNFTLKEPDPKNNNLPNEGYVEVRLISENGTEQTSNIFKRTDFNIENIPPGSHTLILELMQNNQTPHNPRVIATTAFITTTGQETNTQLTLTPTPSSDNIQLPKQTIVFSLVSATIALILISIAIFILLKNKK